MASFITWTFGANNESKDEQEKDDPTEPAEPPPSLALQKAAIQHADCPVCLEPLSNGPIAGFLRDSKRSCRHMVCTYCAAKLIKNSCPMCRKEFDEFKSYQFGTDDCFSLFDWNNSQSLDKAEVVHALNAVLPYSEQALTNYVNKKWPNWDVDGDSTISLEEFDKFTEDVQAVLNNEPVEIPGLDDDAWFTHWDADSSNSLDTAELTLALIHTLHLEGDANKKRRDELVAMIPVVISILDPNGDRVINNAEWPQFRNNLKANLRI